MLDHNYYDVLEINKNASDEDVYNAYRRLSLKCHPDNNLNNKLESEERFKSIASAYAILSDKKKREDYNHHIHVKAKPFHFYDFTGLDMNMNYANNIFRDFFKGK